MCHRHGVRDAKESIKRYLLFIHRIEVIFQLRISTRTGSTDGVRQARDFQLSRQGSRSRSSSANSELRTDVVALGSSLFSDWLRVCQIELDERKLEAKMEADERRKETGERRQRYEEKRVRENQRRLDEIERENQRREDDRARDQRRHEEFMLFMATMLAPKNGYKNNENAKNDG